MRNLRLCVLAAALSFGAGCTSDPDSTLLIINESDYVIEEVYLTDVSSSTWGPNLLGNDVLFPGEDFLLGVDCGTYDARLVDEDGVECELNNLDLCFDDADWVIRNNTCTVFGAARKQREAEAAAKGGEAVKAPAPLPAPAATL